MLFDIKDFKLIKITITIRTHTLPKVSRKTWLKEKLFINYSIKYVIKKFKNKYKNESLKVKRLGQIKTIDENLLHLYSSNNSPRSKTVKKKNKNKKY